MSIAEAKQFIREVRTSTPLRQQFEAVWQGKRKQPDKQYQTKKEPIIPPLLSTYAPDNKEDPKGYARFWGIRRAQQDIHDLLFSKGDGKDHAQNYPDDEGFITDARIEQVLAEEYMEIALNLMAAIANKALGYSIRLTQMKTAWQHYLHWIFHTYTYCGSHDGVQKLRREAREDKDLSTDLNSCLVTGSAGKGVAHAIVNYMAYEFCHEEARETMDKYRDSFNALAAKARERGYEFRGIDYLKDCVARQEGEDTGPDYDDRYWPEDDPARWNYEPPPVRFTIN